MQSVRLIVLALAACLVGHAGISEVTSAECAAASSTCTIGTVAVGDLILAGAYNSGTTTQPTVPAGWNPTKVAGNGANTNALVVGCKVATSTSETAGTWTNATHLSVIVLRGTLASKTASCDGVVVGGQAVGGTATNPMAYNAVTMQVSDGNSWLVAFGGHKSANNVSTAPTGLTNINSAGTGPMIAGFTSNGGKSSWSTQTVTVSTAAGWRTWVGEIKAPCPSGQICADVFVDVNDGSLTTGTTITTANLPAGTHIAANYTDYVTVPAASALTDIVADHAANRTRFLPVVVRGGSTYATSSTSKAVSHVHNSAAGATNWLRMELPAGNGAVSTAGWVTVGPNNGPTTSGLFTYFIHNSGAGDFAVAQLSVDPNTGNVCTPNYGINIEYSVAGSGTQHSSCITLTPGSTYWISLYTNFQDYSGSLYVYDVNGSQVGHVTSSHSGGTVAAGYQIASVDLMADQNNGLATAGVNDGTTSLIENFVVSYTQPQDPMGPGTPPASGYVIHRSAIF